MALLIRLSYSSKILTARMLYPIYEKCTRIDVIDSFTTELTQQKASKWKSLRRDLLTNSSTHAFTIGTGLTKFVAKGILENLIHLRNPSLELDINGLSVTLIDNVLLATLKSQNDNDFYNIINQCLILKILPSEHVLYECIKYLCISGKTALIEDFENLSQLKNPEFCSQIFPFKTYSLWKNGQLEKSLHNITIFYDEHLSNRKNNVKQLHRSILKAISEETLSSKSEAVLVCLLKTAILIYEKHNDIFLLACIWRNCFTSKWFSDQQLSNEIFDDFSQIRLLVAKKSISLCGHLLRNHDVDAVYRLIEIYIKYDYRSSCGNCIRILFDYQYSRKDTRACTEISRSSIELGLPLSDLQNRKLLNLILNMNLDIKNVKKEKHKFEYNF